MADKLGSGAWHEGGSPGGPPAEPDPREAGRQQRIERLRHRRDNARWTAVVGFGLLFGASFSASFLFGGVAMILYGAVAATWWGARLRKVKGDPWAYDPDLDGPQSPDWAKR